MGLLPSKGQTSMEMKVQLDCLIHIYVMLKRVYRSRSTIEIGEEGAKSDGKAFTSCHSGRQQSLYKVILL